EPLFGAYDGRIELKAARLAFTPKLAAQDFRGVVHLGESQIAVQGAEGTIAGGTMNGELVFLRASEGLVGRMALKLTGADAANLLPGEGTISGRLTSEITVEGSGMSAEALVGSLQGKGTF